MPSSAVAWHLTSLAAVECRVVKEGAAITVPVSSFEILVSLRCGLGGLLPFYRKGQDKIFFLLNIFKTKIPSPGDEANAEVTQCMFIVR